LSLALPAPRAGGTLRFQAERLRLAALWLMLVGGAFVFAEPSPYEIGALAAIGAFAATGGLSLRPAHGPLVLVLVVYCLGLTTAGIPVLTATKVAPWLAVSWYLAVTMVFFAIVAAENTAVRMEVVVRAWTLAALIATAAGIAGYFRLFPGAFDLFTLYGRAKGTFNDPNVFGPFLILPMIVAVQAFYRGNAAAMARAGAVLAVLLVGLLLSFSRGAWGAFVISASLMILSGFLTAPNNQTRKRIVVLTVVVIATSILAIAIALLDESTRDLLVQRFAVTQYYDEGEKGRFGSQLRSLTDLIEMPNGYGPMRYKWVQGGDPHNSYVNAFASYGWLGGFSFIVLVAYSYFIGFRLIFKRSPVQHAAQVFFPCLFTSFLQAMQIDIDHWRHVFLFIAAVWGLEAARLRWVRTGVMGTLSSQPVVIVAAPARQ